MLFERCPTNKRAMALKISEEQEGSITQPIRHTFAPSLAFSWPIAPKNKV